MTVLYVAQPETLCLTSHVIDTSFSLSGSLMGRMSCEVAINTVTGAIDCAVDILKASL